MAGNTEVIFPAMGIDPEPFPVIIRKRGTFQCVESVYGGAYLNDFDCDDEGEENEFDLGLPEQFDPGYFGDQSELPRTCCDCEKVFSLPGEGRETKEPLHPFNDYCSKCLGKVFQRWAAQAEENERLAKRLDFTVEEFFYGL